MKNQEHNSIKLFETSHEDLKSVTALIQEIETWVKDCKVAPKSIGAMFIPATDRLIMSIGYKDDVNSYHINLKIASVGLFNINIEVLKSNIEEALESQDIICHELINIGNELYIISMVKA